MGREVGYAYFFCPTMRGSAQEKSLPEASFHRTEGNMRASLRLVKRQIGRHVLWLWGGQNYHSTIPHAPWNSLEELIFTIGAAVVKDGSVSP